MATISKGIKLLKGDVELTNLQEIPELGGEAEAIEITTLADAAHTYTNGILNYGDSLAFKFLYDKTQFSTLADDDASSEWKVELPDGATCSFSGTHSVKLDGVGVNAALTYTLSVKPNSAMVWANA
jgi:hypothetical protein